MSFKVVGDVIEFDGQRVAVFRRDVTPKMRADVEDILHEWEPEPDEPDQCGDCDDKDCQLTELESKIEDLRTERDAYAALLGVKT